MISRLDHHATDTLYHDFADQLAQQGFTGDIELDYGTRTVLATDNSIYQIVPQGLLYPRSTADLSLLLQLASQERYRSVVLSPRGGGTGTNGQSLTGGLLVDTSRYMNQILKINTHERWARIQAGVIKDELNEQLAEYGLFFAPELSTSNRATVGGMVNTDASGQGSVIHGKTRHHVLELTSVLSDGTVWHSSPVDEPTLEQLCQRQDRVGAIHRQVAAIDRQHREQVAATFPRLNRNLTGYDLANIRNSQGQFDLNAILCGSEGTLALISEIKVNLLPIPVVSALVLVFYRSFQASLEDAQTLMTARPDSIETMDSKVLALARTGTVWESVRDFFPEDNDAVDGINLIEFTGDSQAQLQAGIDRLMAVLTQDPSGQRLGHHTVTDLANIKSLWAMRKQAVGLLGKMAGEARPVPFVEDVAVPPKNLAAFIQGFRALLDRYQLNYGMFGHVDAGVLHVRPALDMKDPKQEALIRVISDQVVALAQAHGGVLWGEHGKGIRSEYAPEFFAELYPALQAIKAAFDPHNQLNPGKIATPQPDGALLKIDGVPTRGQYDRTIDQKAFATFIAGMHCNGNGACFNYSPKSAMCPTWKLTRNRVHSPKGRSALIREWLRLQSAQGLAIDQETRRIRQPKNIRQRLTGHAERIRNYWRKYRGESDFSHEVYQAMDSCMSCKSCTGQCPVQVNVPDLRARYFELYHQRYPRPLKHHLASWLEPLLPVMAHSRWLYNRVSQSSWGDALFARLTGLQGLPAIASSAPLRDCCQAGAAIAAPRVVDALPAGEREKTVIIVQDAFTSFFETSLLIDLVELLIRLGYRPLVAPFKPNGKVLHIYGFLGRFARVAQVNGEQLSRLAASGIPLVGLDAAVTLTYRDEYREVMGDNSPEVQLLSEWFAGQLDSIRQLNLGLEGRYTLLSHCTEATNAPASIGHWQALYRACGLQLDYQPTGCCGMSGIYGHETRNQAASRQLYKLSWQAIVDNPDHAERLVATGYSCRSQVKRQSQVQPLHPVQGILKALKHGTEKST